SHQRSLDDFDPGSPRNRVELLHGARIDGRKHRQDRAACRLRRKPIVHEVPQLAVVPDADQNRLRAARQSLEGGPAAPALFDRGTLRLVTVARLDGKAVTDEMADDRLSDASGTDDADVMKRRKKRTSPDYNKRRSPLRLASAASGAGVRSATVRQWSLENRSPRRETLSARRYPARCSRPMPAFPSARRPPEESRPQCDRPCSSGARP